MRQTVRHAAPQAEGAHQLPDAGAVPARAVVYYGAFKQHLGLYPPVVDEPALRERVARYAGPKGICSSRYAEPLPLVLIADVVRARLAVNLAKKPAALNSLNSLKRRRRWPPAPLAPLAQQPSPASSSAAVVVGSGGRQVVGDGRGVHGIGQDGHAARAGEGGGAAIANDESRPVLAATARHDDIGGAAVDDVAVNTVVHLPVLEQPLEGVGLRQVEGGSRSRRRC